MFANKNRLVILDDDSKLQVKSLKKDSMKKVKENQVVDESSPVKIKFDNKKINDYVKEQILNKLNEKNFCVI